MALPLAAAALATLDGIAARRASVSDTAPDPVLELQRGLFAIKAGDREAGWARASGAAKVLEASMDNAPGLAGKVAAYKTGSARLRVLDQERAALLANGMIETAAVRATEITQLSDLLVQLRKDLVDAIPDFADWVRPATPSVAEVQGRLGPDEAVLITMPSRSRTFTMVITADQAVMASSAKGRPQVRALVSELRAALDGKVPDDAASFAQNAAALHDIVLPQRAATALTGRGRAAVVTSDALSRLPFSVLLPGVPVGGQTDYKDMDWMVRRHAFSITLTPSAAFAARRAPGAQLSFLGVGAPNLSGATDPAGGSVNLFRGGAAALDSLRSLRPLPASAGEIARVSAIGGFSSSVALTGEEATELRVRQASGDRYGVLLFATHGLMDGEVAGLNEPALVLTPPAEADQTDNDGLLLASEIGALGLSADFVILSACNSAAGRNETAPAYTGLANAFLGSGAKGLLLSHWRVRDDAAAHLSASTVERALAGASHAEALRQSQLALIEGAADVPDSANPSIWAPFVLIEG